VTTEPINIDDLVQDALAIIERTKLARPGEYRRSALPSQTTADELANEYGVADAANLLYTLGHFPQDEPTRAGFIQTLRSMQNASTGLWSEATHHTYHCTAHCIAALELFDVMPAHPPAELARFKSPQGITGLLEQLDWTTNPWNQSHQGAGVFSALLITGVADEPCRNAYFGWLEQNWDPQTGFLRRGHQPGMIEGSAPLHNHMGSTFHYLFNIEADRRPIPFARQMVDTCLQMAANGEAHAFAGRMSFLFIDWIYCLNRAVRQSAHRYDESRQVLRSTAVACIDFLRNIDRADPLYNDLHYLFGMWCALAELQSALPGFIRTSRPLKLVLDRRPFI